MKNSYNFEFPNIHIWIFNHPVFYGIGDQLHFLYKYFKSIGIHTTCGRSPSLDRLNVVIENFTPENIELVRKFCECYGKSIAIVLTEHFDLKTINSVYYNERRYDLSEIYLHGKSLSDSFEYLPKNVLLQRANSLLSLKNHTSFYLTLGDLPYLNGFDILFNGKRVFNLPFPMLDEVYIDTNRSPKFDFIFIGAKTIFRDIVITDLRNHGFTFKNVETGISVKTRYNLLKDAKFNLNIPQDESWEWLSTMRIISSLQSGVATISIGTSDPSRISTCVQQLQDFGTDTTYKLLRESLDSYKNNFFESFNNYKSIVSNYRVSEDFYKFYKIWSITDGLR